MLGAVIGTQEDGAGFCIGVVALKRTMREDKILFSLGNMAEAVAAGVNFAVGQMDLDGVAVAVGAVAANAGDGLCGQGVKCDHGLAPFELNLRQRAVALDPDLDERQAA